MEAVHDTEEFLRTGREAVNWIAEFLADPGRRRISPAVRPGELVDSLPASGPEQGEALDQLLTDFDSQIMPFVGNWNHPRFFNYFACTGSTPGILGEMLCAAINTNGLNWVASPAVSELEHVALAWLRQWSGLADDYFGEIFDTASVSNMHALAAAREMADPDSRQRGPTKRLRVYCSDQAHSSVDKAVITVGLGLDNLLKVPSDSDFRMDPVALRRLIEADIADGYTPCCIVATLGTTSTTSVDPISAITALGEEFGVWVHIDAAYGGAAMLLPEFRHLLAGQERAHSYVVNPHKWLLTQMDCSAFYTRYPEILRRAFSLTPEYLQTSQDPRAVSLMDYGLPLGRRFRALKLWFIFRYFGREGLANEIRRHIELAQSFRRLIEADPCFEVAAPTPFSTVCFRYRNSEQKNRQIVSEINQSGEFFISQTILRGQFTVRVAIGNMATTQADLDHLWAQIRLIASAAPQQPPYSG